MTEAVGEIDNDIDSLNYNKHYFLKIAFVLKVIIKSRNSYYFTGWLFTKIGVHCVQ